jgi:uncharacterized protein YciI
VDVPITRRLVLHYEFGENALERRKPHREEHIELVREWMADGRILMAGAVGDPPTGGLVVFAYEDPRDVEPFVQADPYVKSGLVTAWHVEPWSVVS